MQQTHPVLQHPLLPITSGVNGNLCDGTATGTFLLLSVASALQQRMQLVLTDCLLQQSRCVADFLPWSAHSHSLCYCLLPLQVLPSQGFTVVPGGSYTLRIAIADASNGLLDSVLLLPVGSLKLYAAPKAAAGGPYAVVSRPTQQVLVISVMSFEYLGHGSLCQAYTGFVSMRMSAALSAINMSRCYWQQP